MALTGTFIKTHSTHPFTCNGYLPNLPFRFQHIIHLYKRLILSSHRHNQLPFFTQIKTIQSLIYIHQPYSLKPRENQPLFILYIYVFKQYTSTCFKDPKARRLLDK